VSSAGRPSFKSLLGFAHELADLSGRILRPYFRKPIAVTDKGRRRLIITMTDRRPSRKSTGSDSAGGTRPHR
jgi:hypothetical protein